MLVNVYAVRIKGQQSWYCAFDLRAAALFWLKHPAIDLGLAIIEPAISYGQAARLLAKLNPGGDQDSAKRQLAKELSILKDFYQGRGLQVHQYNRNQLEQKYQNSWLLAHEVYERLANALSGRQLLLDEVQALVEHVMALETQDIGKDDLKAYIQYAALSGDVELLNGLSVTERRQLPMLWRKQEEYKCYRCGSGMAHMHITHCAICNDSCAYCEACLTMGRIRHCSLLIKGIRDEGQEERHIEPVQRSKGQARLHTAWNDQGDQLGYSLEQSIGHWGLSPAQTEAASSGLQWLETQTNRPLGMGARTGTSAKSRTRSEASRFLIWAVTGAGKTEMIFPFIDYTLARGGKVLIATPRRDVVLELRPRVKRAFPDYATVVLYGGSEQRWDSGPIVIATTHQLLRYHEAFDLVIIDELDAFPYHGDPMLEFAARRACKRGGSTLMLSATPPRQMRRATVRGKLPHVKVPARYHGYPLPVPRQLAVPALPSMLRVDALPSALLAALRASLARGAQLFVFVPSIATVEPLVHLLRRNLLAAVPPSGGNLPPAVSPPPLVIEGTSSKDSVRTDKVQQFRDGHIRILVTTTILERGVTVPKTDVFILDANSRLFDEASLVQMSGRAGRSKDDPAGRVYFAAAERTNAQSGAIAQIKGMNRLAKRKGYLHGRRLGENE